MEYMRRAWNFWVVEPWTWITYCFLQPAKFAEIYDIRHLFERKHLKYALQLITAIFLVSYPVALLIQIGFSLAAGSPWLDFHFFLVVAAGCLGGIVSGFALGVIGRGRESILLALIGGLTADIPFGLTVGLTTFTLSNFVLSLIVLSLEGLALGWFLEEFNMAWRVMLSVAFFVVIARLTAFLPYADPTSFWRIIVENLITGFIIGSALNKRSGIALSIMLLTARLLAGDFNVGLTAALAFLVGYAFGYPRFLFIVYNVRVAIRAFRASQNDPRTVFANLEASPIHFDNRSFYPIPKLEEMLQIAADENRKKALEEIAFIVKERKHRRFDAWAVSLQLAVKDLSKCIDMDTIATASEQLQDFLSPTVDMIDPVWRPDLMRFDEVSKDALNYLHVKRKKARELALENMEWNLKKISIAAGFREEVLSKIASEWLAIVEAERSELAEKVEIGYIDNPYIVGSFLETSSQLYVGRQDIFDRLEEELRKGYKTFLLIGERRMGKSSTLQQLSKYLGSKYIPVIYSLQSPSMLSNASAFLYTVAEGIYEALKSRRWEVEPLSLNRLLNIQNRRGEKELYPAFNKWLLEIDRKLGQEKLKLLLVFDEYELLTEKNDLYFDRSHLETWLEEIIDKSGNMVFLFSGLPPTGERNLQKLLNNAKQLKISLLDKEESRKLILHPVQTFPGERTFGEDVVNEIIRVTGGHPFLIQALCSEIIFLLNKEKRDQSMLEDVTIAADRVLDSWSHYFSELWERTNEDQRTCLRVLKKMGRANQRTIEKQADLYENRVRKALFSLSNRDLVLKDNEMYAIAIPLFEKMITKFDNSLVS